MKEDAKAKAIRNLLTPKAEKHESELKSKLLDDAKKVIPGYVIVPIEDVRRVGTPDWATNAGNRTAWWEFKHGTPDFESHGRQELTMNRLAVASYARYIIWMENADCSNRRTLIIHPKNIGSMETEDWCVGFNNHFILSFMRKVHRV